MHPFQCWFWSIILAMAISGFGVSRAAETRKADGNRLTYLDDDNPFYPNGAFPRLTTPQWIGESGVEAAVVLAIDDMSQPDKYERYLRPILDRLKKIDGRAPLSIMCNRVDPSHPQLQGWLAEGLSFEVHTLTHPCPLLARSNLTAALETYHGGVELLNRIAGSKPVAFRMPCCDSINSPSPRFFAELFNRTNAAGQFLTLDSSVMNILTAKDPSIPSALVSDPDGKEKFRKYVPFRSFATTIENYPYPYVIGKLCWEIPAMAPSDWEAQHLHGTNNPVTVADWKAALDVTVLKQGTFAFIFHPHGWIRPDQLVEFIDYAVEKYGPKVKFLNFRDVDERLRRMTIEPLRAANGQDNGVRLLDVNHDGFMDVVAANEGVQQTRVWSPGARRWTEVAFPVALATPELGERADAGVKFGVLEEDGHASVLANGKVKGVWHFDGREWVEQKFHLAGLELDGQPVLTRSERGDRGVRLRDIDRDGRCELIVGNEVQNGVFAWSKTDESWHKLAYSLPQGTSVVDADGRDNGLRFVDVNDDGFDDVVFSNPSRYSLHLFVPKLYLGFAAGWTRNVLSGVRGDAGEIPMLVRGGSHPNNGAWFHSKHLWLQNEDTAALPDLVDRRSFDELLGGYQPKPKAPAEALSSFRVRPGFKIELVAAEPLVMDPIAFEWGADGKLWVVEMGDYPSGIDAQGRPGGIVRFLEDTDEDGRYDKSTVFLEGVNFPTGVAPWGRGVVVSAAPEIFYAEDKDGDGKADQRILLYRGFVEGNQQHRANGFEYGLDNWLYGANGDSGGRIQAIGMVAGGVAPSLSDRAIDLRGHDFRFRPDHGLFETVAGQTQFGRHRDDWGNWFGNNNPAWLWHFNIPEHYLARNPQLPVKSVKRYLADYADGTRVYPVSRNLQRFNDIAMLGHVTSANSPTPYRDELFGLEYATSVFISEPVHNLVHREVLRADGVSFVSGRAPDEQQSEFLASTDNWFRPIMLKTGPDGALYVADMYRLVLEHPEWIPPDTQKHLDLRAGHNLGRIYRVLPRRAALPRIPKLAGLSPAALVAHLSSPNGWTRDTAQRLLVQSGDRSIAADVAKLAAGNANPKARLQALCTLDGLAALTVDSVIMALSDSHPAVRENAVRLAEPFLRGGSGQPARELAQLEERLLAMTADPDLRVRYQLAFTLGESRSVAAARALVQLHRDAPNEPQLLTAILSSALPHVGAMLETLLDQHSAEPAVGLVQPLLGFAVAGGEKPALAQALKAIAKPADGQYQRWQFQAVAGFLNGLEHQQTTLEEYQNRARGDLAVALAALSPMFERARQVATDGSGSEQARVAAMELLGRGLNGADRDLQTLTGLLRPQVPSPIQRAALDVLKRLGDPSVSGLLLDGWRSYEPGLRNDVLSVLLSRSEWTQHLLRAVESGLVPTAQVSPANQQKMMASSNDIVRKHAARLFAVTSNRRQLLQECREVLELKGNASAGALLFRQNCATCHRLRDEGVNVGPDLGALGSKSAEALLVAILAPNDAVETRYVNYTAQTRSGRELSGILTAETATSVTFRTTGGAEETVLRTDLEEITSSGISLMPEGFENVMTKQQLADLIAFVRGGG